MPPSRSPLGSNKRGVIFRTLLPCTIIRAIKAMLKVLTTFYIPQDS